MLEQDWIKTHPLQEMYKKKYSSLSDKGTDHDYIEFYEELFRSYKDLPIKLLEIGAYKGGSLLMWREYFTKAEIWGNDINQIPDNCKDKNINFVQGMSQNPSTKIPSGFNIIIDDGSHDPNEQFKTFRNLWRKLVDGGIYVIEDCYGFQPVVSNITKVYSEVEITVLDRRINRADSRYGGWDNILVIIGK